jgi:hypothetical protein
MRRLTKMFAVATAVVAPLAGLAAGGGPAMADPLKTPSLTTLVGVGSFSITQLFDNGTSRQPYGDAAGSFVHDYNATKPPYPVASWDAANPVTGITGQTITTKALNSKDTSCQLARPDGSSAGIKALNADQTDAHKVDGQTIYCVDYVRSSRPPNTTTFEDAFVALMRDAMDWSYPTVRGEKNPQPNSLIGSQLAGIYTCRYTNWKQVGGKNAPIGVVMPEEGGTRSDWLIDLGITATDEPCWQNQIVRVKGLVRMILEDTGLTTGNAAQFTKRQEFPDGEIIPPADDIFPYSIGDYIAQGPATKGVGGHATSIWGHGNLTLGKIIGQPPVTKNSKGQPVTNPRWFPEFVITLYAVTRNGCYVSSKPTSVAVCLPSRTPPKGGTKYPTYEVTGLKDLFGRAGWVCTNKTAEADVVSYGFSRLPECGTLKAGD